MIYFSNIRTKIKDRITSLTFFGIFKDYSPLFTLINTVWLECSLSALWPCHYMKKKNIFFNHYCTIIQFTLFIYVLSENCIIGNHIYSNLLISIFLKNLFFREFEKLILGGSFQPKPPENNPSNTSSQSSSAEQSPEAESNSTSSRQDETMSLGQAAAGIPDDARFIIY